MKIPTKIDIISLIMLVKKPNMLFYITQRNVDIFSTLQLKFHHYFCR